MRSHTSPPLARLFVDAPVRPRGRTLAGLGGALVAVTVVPLFGPQVIRRFVDGAAGGRSTSALAGLAALYLGLAVAGQAARIFSAWLASGLAWDTPAPSPSSPSRTSASVSPWSPTSPSS